MGSGIYNEFSVVEADINHIQYLQDNLRKKQNQFQILISTTGRLLVVLRKYSDAS